jgi:hypothetical protein
LDDPGAGTEANVFDRSNVWLQNQERRYEMEIVTYPDGSVLYRVRPVGVPGAAIGLAVPKIPRNDPFWPKFGAPVIPQ